MHHRFHSFAVASSCFCVLRSTHMVDFFLSLHILLKCDYPIREHAFYLFCCFLMIFYVIFFQFDREKLLFGPTICASQTIQIDSIIQINQNSSSLIYKKVTNENTVRRTIYKTHLVIKRPVHASNNVMSFS